MSRSWPKVVARPSPVSGGSTAPQPAFSAARLTTAAWRAAPPTVDGELPALRPAASSSLMRNATGSTLRACAASSMNDSTAQFVQPGPTERNQPGRNARLASVLDNARTRCAPTVYQWSAPEIANGS